MVDMARELVAVDTDLLIDFLRGSGEGIALVRRLVRERRLRITAITAFELRLGADFLEREHDISVLLSRRTVALDTLAALQAGAVFTSLQRVGRGIGLADALQAGICLRYSLPLATRNVRHFRRVEGLELASLDDG